MRTFLIISIITILVKTTFCQNTILKGTGVNQVKLSTEKFYKLDKIASDFYLIGNSDSMFKYAEEALIVASFLKNDSFIVAANKQLGNCSRIKSDFVSALKYYFTGLHLMKDPSRFGILYCIMNNNIGDNYSHLKYYEKSLLYLHKAEEIIEPNNIKYNRIATYIYDNLASTYMLMDSLVKAENYLSLATSKSKVAKDTAYIVASIYIDYGILNSKFSDKKELANYYFKKAIEFSKSNSDFKHLANSYSEYAKFLMKINNYNEAKKYSNESYQISKMYNYTENILENSELLSKIYFKNKLFDSAYLFSNLADSLKDKISSTQAKNQLLTMALNEQTLEIQNDFKINEEKKHFKQSTNFTLIGIAVLILIIIYLLFTRSVFAKSKHIVVAGETLLLITFEFINLILHPKIELITNHDELLMFLCLATIAYGLVKLHHLIEKNLPKLVSFNRKRKELVLRELEKELAENSTDTTSSEAKM